MPNQTIWCPHCGHQHTPVPYKYRLESEFDSFEDQLEGFETEGEGEETVVTIHGCFVEAGPHNGDRCLVDMNMDLLECPCCNKAFAKQ